MNAPDIALPVLFFASIFTSNILLANFLGMCSFITISSNLRSAHGLGLAVIVVMSITSIINWLLYTFVISVYNLEFLGFIIFIIVIAAVVQMLEMVIERISPPLYMALGIFLPLITVNCAILGVVLFIQIRNYSWDQALIFGIGSGIGWWLAIVALAAIRQKIDKAPVPSGLKGAGITLITIGLMAMAFLGFSGMLSVQ
ncbi:MAG: NADH:ubiquinone reductase (Na(+)-transporting) subunit E [Spirochaetales bacterium]|nr:NADH:ubiquinone reductase (Na(+)-transporting) subunit E [Spirochaetales bacterium]